MITSAYTILKKIILSRISKVIPVLILLGVSACVLHVTPQISHDVSGSHSAKSSAQIACIDHQVSRSCSTEDHAVAMFIAAPPPHPTGLTQNLPLTYAPFDDDSQYGPYARERLYIKNNTFLI